MTRAPAPFALIPPPAERGCPVLRKAILAAAESPRLQRGVRRHGMRLGASRFVAGETLDQAVVVLRRLNEKGLRANTTLLGEGVSSEAETRAVVDAYREILDRIAAEQLRVNVALKLTHLGLAFDEELAQRQHRRARRARRRARQLRPARHGGVDVRRRDPAGVPGAARGRPRERRHRPAVVPLPHARRPRGAPRPDARTSASSRAPTSSRPPSPTPRRRTSTPRTRGWSSAPSRPAASPRSRRTTRR